MQQCLLEIYNRISGTDMLVVVGLIVLLVAVIAGMVGVLDAGAKAAPAFGLPQRTTVSTARQAPLATNLNEPREREWWA